MKKATLIIAAIIFAFVASTSAFAWGPGQGKHQGRGFDRECPRGGSEWNAKLTDDQKKQLKELRQKFVDETADLRIDLHSKSEKMRILLETSGPDREELKSLAKEMSDLKGQLMAKQIDLRLEAKKIAPELRTGKGFLGFGGFGKYGMGQRFHGKGGPGEFCGRE